MLLAGTLALVGAGASVARGLDVDAHQNDNARAVMDRHAEAATASVQTGTDRYVDTLRTTAGAVGPFEHLTSAKFSQIAASHETP